ncbi:MAG: hypothetical protein WCI74_08345 [Actinomycetes bacterium]
MTDPKDDVVVTSETEYVTEDGGLVIDEVAVVVDSDGNVLAADELITIEEPDGSGGFDEILSVADSDGNLIVVDEVAGVIDADGNAVVVESELEDVDDE